jgi:hypothetical protein
LASALTTTALFKSYAGITHADDDTLIGLLVDRAADAIEKYCDRIFASTTYREQYNGMGDCEIFLNEYPITDVQMVSLRTVPVIRITNANSDAWNAHGKVTYTGADSVSMVLTVQGGANDGADTLTLTPRKTYTVTTLVTAINALGTGWTATVDNSN